MGLQAQIKLQKSSLVTTSSIAILHEDTSTWVSTKYTSQENTSWDYSNLIAHDTEYIQFRNADWYPSRVQNAFPNATYIFQDGDYTYLQVKDSSMVFLGSASDTGAGPLQAEAIGFDFIRFPLQYGDTNQGEDLLVFQVEDSLGLVPGPGAPTIDSTRVQAFLSSKFIGVGTGDLILSNVTFKKTIQVLNEVLVYPKVFAKIGNNWIEIDENYARQLNIPYDTDTSYRMMWWGTLEGNGFPIMQYEYEPDEDSVQFVQFAGDDIRVSNQQDLSNIELISYPNPTSETVIIKGVDIISEKVQIFNLTGELVAIKSLDSNQAIDLSDLNTGTYLIYVQSRMGGVQLKIQKL